MQAIYILDENNYNKKYNQFAEGFLKWGNENVSKIIKDRFKEIIPLLKNLNIKSSTSKMEMNNETFNIKEQFNYFVLGVNNDKKERPIDNKELFKNTPFEFIINKKANKYV